MRAGACAAEMLLLTRRAPVRMANLAAITFRGRKGWLSAPKAGGLALLVIPASQTKNRREIRAHLQDAGKKRSWALVTWYLARMVALDGLPTKVADGPALFPGLKDDRIGHSMLRDRVKMETAASRRLRHLGRDRVRRHHDGLRLRPGGQGRRVGQLHGCRDGAPRRQVLEVRSEKMTIRIGVIGTGAIGRDHTRRINRALTGATVVALSDVNAGSASAVKADLAPDATIFATGEELIASPEVDAVLVASWGETHEQYVLAAIAAGKPCFCEKPLATTAKGARRIVDAEAALGRRLVQVGFMRRYDTGYRMLKAVVDREIGRPLMVHAAHRNPDVPAHYVTEMAINDTLIHEIDVLRWLLDDDYVSAQVVFPRRTSAAPRDLRDPQVVLLETAKGVRIDVEVFVNCRYGYDIQCQVVGEDGIAALPEPMAVVLRKDAKLQSAILTDWKDRFVASYDVELQDFVDAAARGAASGPTAWDGYVAAISSDACLAAQEAPGTIVPITLPGRPALYA